jgi:hypothetical protein
VKKLDNKQGAMAPGAWPYFSIFGLGAALRLATGLTQGSIRPAPTKPWFAVPFVYQR